MTRPKLGRVKCHCFRIPDSQEWPVGGVCRGVGELQGDQPVAVLEGRLRHVLVGQDRDRAPQHLAVVAAEPEPVTVCAVCGAGELYRDAIAASETDG